MSIVTVKPTDLPHLISEYYAYEHNGKDCLVYLSRSHKETVHDILIRNILEMLNVKIIGWSEALPEDEDGYVFFYYTDMPIKDYLKIEDDEQEEVKKSTFFEEGKELKVPKK